MLCIYVIERQTVFFLKTNHITGTPINYRYFGFDEKYISKSDFVKIIFASVVVYLIR